MPPKGGKKLNVHERVKRALNRAIRARGGYRKGRYGGALKYSLVGFPKTKLVRMRYCGASALQGDGIANYQKYSIAANDLYDPDITSTGHQPLGHDQWAQFYNHYVVVSSKITVSFQHADQTSVSSDQLVIGIVLDDDTSLTATNVSTLQEQGNTRYKIIPNYAADPSVMRVSKTFSTKKFFNVTNVKDNLDRLGGTFNTAFAGDKAVFNIVIGDAIDGASSFKPVNFQWTVDYLVLCSEPRELPVS